MTKNERSLRKLRAEGWYAGVLEKWVQAARRRVDYQGFIDLLAFRPDEGILAIQACSNDLPAHFRKIEEEPHNERLIAWLQSGGRFEIWEWVKRKAENSKRKLFICRKHVAVLCDDQVVFRGHSGGYR